MRLLPILCLALLPLLGQQTPKPVNPAWRLGPFKGDPRTPLLIPRPHARHACLLRRHVVAWEMGGLSCPTPIVDEGGVHVVYQAKDDSPEHISRLGLASGHDPRNLVPLQTPVLFPKREDLPELHQGGMVNPRVVATADGRFVLTYSLVAQEKAQVAVATSRDLRTWTRHGAAFGTAQLGSSSGGAILCRLEKGRLVAALHQGRYWMYWGENVLHVASSRDLLAWEPLLDSDGKPRPVLSPRQGSFDELGVSLGAPPILTPEGIVMLYHGFGFQRDLACVVPGQVLLSAEDPTRVLDRPREPLTLEHAKESQGVESRRATLGPDPLEGELRIHGLFPFKGRWWLAYSAQGKIYLLQGISPRNPWWMNFATWWMPVKAMEAPQAKAQEPYRDPSLLPDARAKDLVGRLTLQEKLAQLMHESPAIPHLGIPAYVWWNECLHGVGRAGRATVFPQAIGLAATWDPQVLGEVAEAIGREGRAKSNEARLRGESPIYHGLTFWSPNLNLFRDPRWGRGQETYGEDPFLTGRLGTAFVRGLQGPDPNHPMALATPKHFAVHSGPEADRHSFDARPPLRDFYESYLPHFEQVVKEGRPGSVMGAYNRVFGEPACASPLLLDTLLRKTWGFKGYVTSDCWALSDMVGYHKTHATKAEAAAAALRAGLDLECGVDFATLEEALAKRLVKEEDVDRALGRLFAARFRLGLLDPVKEGPHGKLKADGVGSPAHRELAQEAARKSLVLLSNQGLLPLSGVKKVAVLGPNADTLNAFLGNYSGEPGPAPTVLEALRERLGSGVEVLHYRTIPHARSPRPLGPISDVFLEAGGKPGLWAEYFPTENFTGTSVRRQDGGVDFLDLQASHVRGLALGALSARWTGVFVAPAEGRYALGLKARGRARLWLDEILAVDHWKQVPGRKQVEGTHNLPPKKGQRVRIRLEYATSAAPTQCQLLWDRPRQDPLPTLLQKLKGTEAVVFVGGLTRDLEGEGGELREPLEGLALSGDRTAIELPALQRDLLQTLHAAGHRVVLVNLSGGAMAMPWEAEHLGAILQAWYPGEGGGSAIARVLLGEDEPGGRLPLTFYRSTQDLRPFSDYRMEGRTYRFFPHPPLWPFGHGLGYTTFKLEDLEFIPDLPLDGTLDLTFKVTNTGTRVGEVVPQVYVRQMDGEAPALQDLRGFQRLRLDPGERREVRIRVPVSSLRRWVTGTVGTYEVQPGRYEVRVGFSAGDQPLKGVVRVGR